MTTRYDEIGLTYAQLRQPDQRIADLILEALGDARRVVNVGAGAGSYEPADRLVVAVEPSATMINQRPEGAAPVVQGVAEALPFADKSFDAAMAVLTIHHWHDQPLGLREMRRVATGPIVILTYDPAFRGFWLTDYLPELIALDDAQMPPLSMYEDVLGPVTISEVPIPHDCTDGFLCAYWRRPEAYLDPRVRAAMSSFAAIGDVSPALARIARDLASGAWQARYGALKDLEATDLGYRLVVAP